jgi:hypothetical protein|tara:strand:- start:69 stop:500 length:432 start_codon:yes stop_codon:yes gene_type:complete
MKRLISILTLSTLIAVGCNMPTEPQQPNEIDEIEMMLNAVNDNDVPMTLSKGDDDKKGKGKGMRGRGKKSFRHVMGRLYKYLKKNPNEQAQELLGQARSNMKIMYEMKKSGNKDGLKELVKETRGLLREVIKLVRESRKSNRG